MATVNLTDVPADWLEVTRQVERFARRFFRGRPEIDVDDVVQEIILSLLRRCWSGRSEPGDGARRMPDDGSTVVSGVAGRLSPFAMTVAHRRCVDALRRSYVSRKVMAPESQILQEPAVDEPGADERLERVEVLVILREIQGRLTPRCKAVLDQLLLGMHLAEAARALGTSAGAVRNRWFHCRKQIQALLSETGLRREANGFVRSRD